jgi:molybdopterin-guanine dinucleotide biosynthesis protein A
VKGKADTPGWNYHPVELLVRPRGLESTLARRLATNLSQFHQAALVRHGPSYLARPLEQSGIGAARVDGVWAVVGANGQDCLYSHEGHFDLLQQRTLLVDVDMAVVEGCFDAQAPTIIELDPDGGGMENLPSSVLENLVACVGPRRPGQIPPGGIPWFRPQDEEGLLDLCLDHLGRALRKRPFWGLLLAEGRADRPDLASQARILAEHCDRCFILGPADPSWAAMGWESAGNAYPSLGLPGVILSCQERKMDAAFLILDDSPDSSQTELIERLVAQRDPYRTATVFREMDTHLPSPFPGIWEPKSKIRTFQARSAGLSCPQRILTHSRIQLLDRTDSNSG